MNTSKQAGTVGSATYNKIKRDIIFGQLEPGAKLKLESLKALYKTSPSTLRETLNRLVSDGFVEAPQQRGFFVKPVSGEDLTEIANLRILLECHALRLSIANRSTEWEANLVAAHHKLHLSEQKMLADDDAEKETWKKHDYEFHQALIAACNFKNLLSLHRIIYDKYLRYQMLVLTHRGAPAAREHRIMREASLAGDADRAEATLTAHINNGLKHTLKAMAR